MAPSKRKVADVNDETPLVEKRDNGRFEIDEKRPAHRRLRDRARNTLLRRAIDFVPAILCLGRNPNGYEVDDEALAEEPIDEKAETVRIFQINDDHSYAFKKRTLKTVLLDERYADKKISVISIAGAFRMGKSFLLNFLVRYLKAMELNGGAKNDGWLEADTKLDVFSWRGGEERHTDGIMICRWPFIVKNSKGEEVVVLLMDTQGTFDTHSTMRDCTFIFALSALISSVLIFNLREPIGENDLGNLQYFTAFGLMAMKVQEGADKSKIEKDFLPSLTEFLENVLDPEKLVVKEIKGREMTCREFGKCVETSVKALQNPNLPKATPHLEASVAGQNLEAARAALALYSVEMSKKRATAKSSEELELGHKQFRRAAINQFEDYPKMGSADDSAPYLTSLEENIDEKYMLQREMYELEHRGLQWSDVLQPLGFLALAVVVAAGGATAVSCLGLAGVGIVMRPAAQFVLKIMTSFL
ncbi:unnamed protein product, partial [Mesorhabditis spiculigera]